MRLAEVVVEGGVITNGSLLPPLTTASYGSEVVFEAGYMRYPAIVYDTVNDKIVIAYADYGDSNKGKAVVGTVSGTSISYGSIVEFNSGSTDYVTAVFDTSAGKVVIGYRDAGNSNYGTAIVGTVSGTSISFGTEVVFESASSMYIKASYDTNASKTLFVCFYKITASFMRYSCYYIWLKSISKKRIILENFSMRELNQRHFERSKIR